MLIADDMKVITFKVPCPLVPGNIFGSFLANHSKSVTNSGI